MTAVELLAECNALDIVLQRHGDRLNIDAPQGTLTSELTARLRSHKAELLALLRSPAATPIELTNAKVVWQAVLDRLEGHPLFPPDLIKVLRLAETRWVADEAAAPGQAATRAAAPARPICRCGSTTSQDVQIHDGKSVRRDCARCRRFIEFPVWYGNPAKM